MGLEAGQDREHRELRLAVAMNGGVSLAVWIGGVAYELWRFAQAEGAWRVGPHQTATASTLPGSPRARIDVLSGTSAGGINAVFLALASLYPEVRIERPDGQSVPAMRAMRDLWLDDAGLEPPTSAVRGAPQLIRDPAAKPLRSLLDGDHFHRRLCRAVGLLLPQDDSATPAIGELDLQLTATSLRGDRDDVVGDDGQVFHNRTHASFFHYRHGLGGRCDLSVGSEERRVMLARALARAARSTASFPFAFEPSSVAADDLAVGRIEGAAGTVFVDGGVLNNLPVDRAVDAIFQMPADGPVERHLVVVVPDPSSPGAVADQSPRDAASDVASVVLAAGVGIPRTQSIADTLRDLRANNGAVEALRDARSKLLERTVEELAVAADAVWASYQANRRVHTARQLAEGWARARADTPLRFEDFAEVAREVTFPWLPATWAYDGNGDAPCWGASTVRRMVATLLHLIGEARAHAVAGLGNLQEHVHDVRRRADQLNPLSLGTERVIEAMRGAPFKADALTQALAEWPHAGAEPPIADVTHRRNALARLISELGGVLVALNTKWPADRGRPALVGGVTEANAHRVLCGLEVVQHAFRDFAYQGEQLVRVSLLSPRLPCELDPRRRDSAAAKLAGDELGHFGAFLKRSWRANDWMWGRLDAATFLGTLTDATGDARRAQVEIVMDEAPVLCQAVQEDARQGARNEFGHRLVTPAGDQPADVSCWSSIKETLGLGADDDTAAACFLNISEIGRETVRSEQATTLIARVGTRAAATSAQIVRTADLPLRPVLSRAVAPASGLARSAHRYTRSIRPSAEAEAYPRTRFLLATGALLVPAAVAFASLFGLDLGVVGPLAWIALIGALLGAALIAPTTTALLAAGVAVTGLLAALPDEPWPWLGDWARNGDGDEWRWSWLPLNLVLALGIMAVALVLVPSRPADWVDERWAAIRRRARETAEAWRAGPGPPVGMGWTVATLVLLVGLPAAKWLQIEHVPDGDWWRQLGLVALLVAAVAVRYGPDWWRAVGAWQVAWPAPDGWPARGWTTGNGQAWRADRGLRLMLGLATVALAAAAGIMIVGEDATGPAGQWRVGGLLAAALAMLAVLAAVEIVRHRVWRLCHSSALRDIGRGDAPLPTPPDRAVLWTVAPAVLVWCAVLLAGLARGTPLDAAMAGAEGSPYSVTPWLDGGPGRLLYTALVVGLGEELIYRGLLFALVLRNRLDHYGLLLISLSFAAWHLPDAWGDTGELIVVLVATFLASHLILVPLRLRCRTLGGPVLLHTATNASLLLL